MLYIYLTYWRIIVSIHHFSPVDHRWGPIWAKPNPFNICQNEWGDWAFEHSRAVLQAEFRGLHYYEGLKLLEHPSLGLRLTNAATWQKEAEFTRILKEITRKSNRSFQSISLWAEVPRLSVTTHGWRFIWEKNSTYCEQKVRNLFVVELGLLTE